MMSDLLLISPVWAVFLSGVVALGFKLCNRNREFPVWVSAGIYLAGLFTAILLLCVVVWPAPSESAQELFSGALIFNHTRALGGLVLLLAGVFIVLMSVDHPQVNGEKFSEILFLKIGALTGLFILLLAGNLLTAFIGLETASLAFYLLVALGRTGPLSLQAGFKYFVLGSIASAFMLYGIAFFIGTTGDFDLQRVLYQNPALVTGSRLLALSLVFILVGFLFKISIFPFHFWLPDVYRGAFTPLLVFMATGLKVTVFVLLFDWTKELFLYMDMPFVLSLFQWLAVLSVLFGNITALLQTDFKRTLLFSTIAHSGYLLMILICAQAGFAGKPALFYYLMVYVCMTAGVFICLRPFEKPGTADIAVQNIEGLLQQNPLLTFFITVFLLSLAGVPPTGGFIAKLFVFQSLLDRGFWWMLFWMILGSGIALFYYLKPMTLMYMKNGSSEGEKSPVRLPGFLNLALILLSGFILISGVAPALLLIF